MYASATKELNLLQINLIYKKHFQTRFNVLSIIQALEIVVNAESTVNKVTFIKTNYQNACSMPDNYVVTGRKPIWFEHLAKQTSLAN